jgi:hypothetical protein
MVRMKVIIGYSMISIYAIAGAFLLIKGIEVLSPIQNNVTGIILVIYAAFRTYRLRILQKEEKKEQDMTDES